MVGMRFSRALNRCAALAVAGIFFTAPALAATVTLSPATSNAARDGGNTSTPRDGQFDALLPATNLSVSLSQGTGWASDIRALYEFVLPAAVLVPGTVINSANLTLTVNLETLNGGNADMVLHGYLANDSVVTLSDFAVTNPVSQLTLWNGGGGGVGSTRTYNIPYWLQTLPGGTNSRIGLIVATNTYGTNLRYNGPSAQLIIDYTPPVGTPPNLQILQPNNNAVYVAGDWIPFQATAFDNEDGDRSWAITWNSNINGTIAWGGSSMSNALSVGTHLITATVSDSNSNVSTKTRNITVTAVANQPPTVSITAPANGVTVNSDAIVNFTATATDPEQGSLTSAIKWYLNGNQIGSSGSLTTTVPAGTQTVTARVTDSGGLSGEQSITVNSVTPPPPTTWCATQPTDGSSYWQQAMQFNTVNYPTGPNGGFGDYSATTVAGLKGATNTITLTPGSTGGTAIQWYSVWIDLNNDFVFSPGELVLQDSSLNLAPITRGFLVSAGWPPGPRRMRIAMHTNAQAPACGIFPAGEVEDYTIDLQSPPTPPPPPPAAYCSSRATTSSYEFIRGTVIAGVSRTSNNNGGYADFTTSPPINLARGANAITLTPGFGSGTYPESWRVWVDLNKNNLFDSDESLYSGSSSGSTALNGQIVIPSTALTGSTRLRVQMKYGGAPTQCEQFYYGEVEDYAVNIAP